MFRVPNPFRTKKVSLVVADYLRDQHSYLTDEQYARVYNELYKRLKGKKNQLLMEIHLDSCTHFIQSQYKL